ncbi:hypothetical protein C8F04DRAFT_1278082 [Mycena alexandri]|uniref:Ribonuclease H1 N-terminal domain-containing protein n=1 Tax=Mycena alexandri TaxID=1745969 RepID=A0AAD6WRD6_9AGAR|nr:hypothetical protein C8F04DRAFT_1278082 [Mycena alexandri]
MTNIRQPSLSAPPSPTPTKAPLPRPRCTPPFYLHTPAHRDVWTLSDTAGLKFYVVTSGRGIGFFTDSDDANLQTDNYTNASKRSFARWPEARSYWNTVCDEDHCSGCPVPQLARGFTGSLPAPSATPPTPLPAISVLTSPAPTPAFIFHSPISPSATATPANTAATTSPFSSQAQAPISPSPRRSTSTTSPAALHTAATAPAAAASTRSLWAVPGLNRLFLRRADAFQFLPRGGELMFTSDLDALEEAIAPTSQTASTPGSSQPGFATRFWAVAGGYHIFSSRADAVALLLASSARAGVSLMVSDDLDELEEFLTSPLS